MEPVAKPAPHAAKTDVRPNSRIIGISHRVKQKKDQEPRPTLVAVMDRGTKSVQNFKLETEQDELDFLNGQCPIKWRDVKPGEDISAIPEHQVVFRDPVEDENVFGRHASQCVFHSPVNAKIEPKLVKVAKQVPSAWIGLETGDAVAMTLGGSGDYFAYALSRKLEDMHGAVVRIPPFKLKDHRGEGSKDSDPTLLAQVALEHPAEFYETFVRDRGIIRLRIAYRNWMETMKARMGCEQRLGQHAIGIAFCNEEGKFPEGSLEKAAAELKANDPILQALLAEEAKALKELEKAVYDLDVWDKVFEPIPGIGPRIAARIINAIIDIRRFKKASQLVAFLGVHVLKDGKFARRRNNQIANWHPDGRQALYLLADQFNRQAKRDTRWGNYLIKMKVELRKRHPVVETSEGGKKRYTDGHIHKTAIWRTLTRFAEFLHREWWKLEKSVAEAGSQE